jgi:voltage-gated potassium channel
MNGFKRLIDDLYTGRGDRATAFRYGLIGFDFITIVFFIATAPLDPTPGIFVADIVIGCLILADLAARLWIAPNRLRRLREIHTLADIVVILSLLLAPLISQNLGFLRVLRTLRLLHSYHVVRDLRDDSAFFRVHEELIVGIVNLFVFVFVMTALVFALQAGRQPNIAGYLDALYFTVSALTTTGFGDITLEGPWGKLLSVFIMLAGIGLFLRLAQTIFRPAKVRHTCPECGLNRHETDAVHCKHCGEPLKIETGGAG